MGLWTRLSGGRLAQLPDVKLCTRRSSAVAMLGAIAFAMPGASTTAATAAPASHRPTTSARAALAPMVQDKVAEVTSHKTVPFSGHYRGTVSLLINNGSVSIVSVRGKGFATLIGTSTVSGSGTASASAQCDPFTGTGTITGKSGKVTLKALQSK